MYLGANVLDMATNEDVDTSRARVQTYVPAYQKDRWERHADELGMSLSEFVRSMVQAGRSDVSIESVAADDAGRDEGAGTPSSDPDPQGLPLEDRVESVLDDGEYYDWDELLTAVTDDVEARLEETLQSLQERDRIRYSGPHGGYTLS